MSKKIPAAVSAYMAAIGRKGGKRGKGVKKKPKKAAPRSWTSRASQ